MERPVPAQSKKPHTVRGGKLIDYNWDYAQVRQIVEAAVQAQGWHFETVLFKGKARY